MATAKEPKGRMALWLNAMRDEPNRIWYASEAAEVMGIPIRKVGGYAAYAMVQKLIFRRKTGDNHRRMQYSLNPFPDQEMYVAPLSRHIPKRDVVEWKPDPSDPRIPRVVAGWKPPVMTPPRAAA